MTLTSPGSIAGIVIVVLLAVAAVVVGILFGLVLGRSTSAQKRSPTVTPLKTVTITVLEPITETQTAYIYQNSTDTYPQGGTVAYPSSFASLPTLTINNVVTRLMGLACTTSGAMNQTLAGFTLTVSSVTQGGETTTTPTVGYPIGSDAVPTNTNSVISNVGLTQVNGMPALVYQNSNTTDSYTYCLATNVQGSTWNTANNLAVANANTGYSGVAIGVLSSGAPICAFTNTGDNLQIMYQNDTSGNIGQGSTVSLAYGTPNGITAWNALNGPITLQTYSNNTFSVMNCNFYISGACVYTYSTIPVPLIGGSALTTSDLKTFSIGSSFVSGYGALITTSPGDEIPAVVGALTSSLVWYYSSVSNPTSASSFTGPITINTSGTPYTYYSCAPIRILSMLIEGTYYPIVLWIANISSTTRLCCTIALNSQGSEWNSPTSTNQIEIDPSSAQVGCFDAYVTTTSAPNVPAGSICVIYSNTTDNFLHLATIVGSISGGVSTATITRKQLGSQHVSSSNGSFNVSIIGENGNNILNAPAIAFYSTATSGIEFLQGGTNNPTLDDSIVVTYTVQS